VQVAVLGDGNKLGAKVFQLGPDCGGTGRRLRACRRCSHDIEFSLLKSN